MTPGWKCPHCGKSSMDFCPYSDGCILVEPEIQAKAERVYEMGYCRSITESGATTKEAIVRAFAIQLQQDKWESEL